MTEAGSVQVRVNIANTGDRDGREVVQLYVEMVRSVVERPVRELKAFAVAEVAAGASRDVVLEIPREDFAYWDTRVADWVVESGEYTFHVGSSSRDLRTSVHATLTGDPVHVPVTRDTSLGEIALSPALSAALDDAFQILEAGSPLLVDDDDMRDMMASFPVGRMTMFGLAEADIDTFLTTANPLISNNGGEE